MNVAQNGKAAFIAVHNGFHVEHGLLTLKSGQFDVCESAVMISYNSDSLPFATEFELSLTPSEYGYLALADRYKIKQIYLLWARGFDFEGLGALESLQTYQCCEVNFWGLIQCTYLRYFGASEMFSTGCVDLRVLSFLGLSGVALRLINMALPDMLLPEFYYYDTGDTAFFDRFNGYAVRLVRSDRAAQQLSAELYERFCRFTRANSAKLRNAYDGKEALARKYHCLKELAEFRRVTRQCEYLYADLYRLWRYKRDQTV